MSTATPASPVTRHRLFLAVSVFANLVLAVVLVLVVTGPALSEDAPLTERHFAGDPAADDKIAVIRISGILADHSTEYVLRQIERSAKDRAVKAVVVRIESPGGTITASDLVHRSLVELRDNSHQRFTGTGPKPLVASMGSIAASGGYYVAMPAGRVIAEPTTITGSIGVFVALPNVSELASQNGITVELVKAGALKAGGSPFQPLTAEERQPWQDLVDHAYDRFLEVVAAGRPELSKERLVNEQFTYPLSRGGPGRQAPKDNKEQGVAATVSRYRADGATFTPPQALKLGLIDEIGDLSRAIQLSAELNGIARYRAVAYERPKSLVELILGTQVRQQTTPLDAGALQGVLTPRIWYLSPSYELAGALNTSQER